MNLAITKDNKIVIEVPFNTLPYALEYVLETRFDPADESYEIEDLEEFAREITRELNSEEEDGTTAIHEIFDAAILRVIENGSFGLREIPAPKDDDENLKLSYK